MNSPAAATTARRSHRHIHDPGARTILKLVLGQRKHLKQHAKQIAQATHAQPGENPASGAPLPDIQGLVAGLRSLRGDLLSLHHSITRVRCHTAAGRHGKAVILQTFSTLDSSLRTFATAVQTPDRGTRASLVQQAQDLNRQARLTVKTALASLER